MLEKAERWAVVGGGILGMTLAHRLRQRGKNVTLFEAADQLGGLASSWQIQDVVWDRHYHVILLSDTWVRSLLGELGLDGRLEWVKTRTGFFTDGQFHSMSNSLEFLLFPPLRLIDKIRLAGTILYASRIKAWKGLESIAVSDWLRKWSGKNTFEKIWLPLLLSKLGESYKETSAAFIWATINRLYAARRSGLKQEMFGYVQGGYGCVLDRFAELLAEEGVAIELGLAVKNVCKVNGDRLRIRFQNGRETEFDRVILTVPAPISEHLCPELTAEEKSRLKGSRYQGIICASLLLKEPLSEFYLTNLTDPGFPFTAVVEMSALVDRKHFGGKALVYLPRYSSPDDPAFLYSDDEIKQAFLEVLERMYPSFKRQDIVGFRVSRARHVFALSSLNRSEHLPPIVTTIPGLYLLNSAHIVNATLTVNETIQLAETGITQILSASDRLPLSARSLPHDTNQTYCQPLA